MLNALLTLKKNGYIERASETKYFGVLCGDHIFQLKNGKFASVDNVLRRVIITEVRPK